MIATETVAVLCLILGLVSLRIAESWWQRTISTILVVINIGIIILS
jgi:hypothetical protein